MVHVHLLSAVAALCVACAGSICVGPFRVLHWPKRDPHPLHRTTATAQKRVLDVLPELIWDVIVDERVQAAVETGQAQGRNVETVAVISPAVSQESVMHDQHRVTWNEADQERYEHRYDENHGSLVVFSSFALDCGLPKWVKEKNISCDDDQHWDEEDKTCHHHKIIIRQLNIQERIVRLKVLHADKIDVVAGGDVEVREFNGLLVQVQRCSTDPNEDPDTHGYDDSKLVVFSLLGEWVSADPVPLDAQTSDEEDGAVHVAVEETHQNFAHPFTKSPVISFQMVSDLERRPDDKHQVSQR